MNLAILLLLGILVYRPVQASPAESSADPGAGRADHECQIFGYVFGDGAGEARIFSTLCAGLFSETLPLLVTSGRRPAFAPLGSGGGRPAPSRDGWGFGYFLAPPHPGLHYPILVRGGPPACEDNARWSAATQEITNFGLGAASCVLGHVRKSSYGPDSGALPDPHPFADSLSGRWWLFSHNGHMLPDSLLNWIPPGFLTRHPLDYDEIYVDSELFFRYCQYEIEHRGKVRDGLLFALRRVKNHDNFVFNICLTAGDTLWTAHSLDSTPFYYGAAADSAAWWASTVAGESEPSEMEMHHLYWFAPQNMGSASYE
jgi:predicted glutamine amidotransferase